MSVMLYPCMLCVALLMCLFGLCVSQCLCLGVVVILMLSVMDVFSVCGGALLDRPLWIDHVWSSKECVCCACDPNERLSAPSICFVCVFVCRKLSPHLGV